MSICVSLRFEKSKGLYLNEFNIHNCLALPVTSHLGITGSKVCLILPVLHKSSNSDEKSRFQCKCEKLKFYLTPLRLLWSYHWGNWYEFLQESRLYNAKCCQTLKILKNITTCCQILLISEKITILLYPLFSLWMAWILACTYSFCIQMLLYPQKFHSSLPIFGYDAKFQVNCPKNKGNCKLGMIFEVCNIWQHLVIFLTLFKVWQHLAVYNVLSCKISCQ